MAGVFSLLKLYLQGKNIFPVTCFNSVCNIYVGYLMNNLKYSQWCWQLEPLFTVEPFSRKSDVMYPFMPFPKISAWHSLLRENVTFSPLESVCFHIYGLFFFFFSTQALHGEHMFSPFVDISFAKTWFYTHIIYSSVYSAMLALFSQEIFDEPYSSMDHFVSFDLILNSLKTFFRIKTFFIHQFQTTQCFYSCEKNSGKTKIATVKNVPFFI